MKSTREAMAPLAARRGSVPVDVARAAVGKATRVAQVVPDAAPFVASLWAALTAADKEQAQEGRRHAPPGRVACVRFSSAAAWILALLDSHVLPLRRLVWSTAAQDVRMGPWTIEFDASPWGGGAVLYLNETPASWMQCVWDTTLLSLIHI